MTILTLLTIKSPFLRFFQSSPNPSFLQPGGSNDFSRGVPAKNPAKAGFFSIAHYGVTLYGLTGTALFRVILIMKTWNR